MISPLLHDDPHTVGPFRILARLGGGGMGTVYLGRSAAGRTVAVKTLHTRLAGDTTLRTRFRLETDAARVMGAVHGAAVVDADPQAPTPWLATEYVLGPPLDTAVEAGGPLPEPAVRALGAALAAGLEQLHRSEVVHRDLKPSNILVTAQGPRIIDFGIARAFGDEHLTNVGSAVGTPAFMSPEQAAGLEHAAAGDVFALAGVLIFAATGTGPFGGGAPTDLLYRVRFGEPDLGRVPESLRELLARCLAKDPAHRPSTGELHGALGGAAAAPGDRGGFAVLLPDAVLREIARRSDEVWREPPPRLAPPVPTEAPRADAAPAAGVSRRRLLAVAGGALLGGGVLGGAGWALFSGPSDNGGGGTKKDAVDRPKPPSALWSAGLWCPESGGEVMPVGRNLAMRAGIVLCGINAESGQSTWQANIADVWRSATDGTRLYALRDYQEDAAALAVCEVSQTDGQLGKPLAELAAFTGKEQYNQLLCVAGGTAYLVARAASGGRWYLVAADLGTGKERWRSPVDAPQSKGFPAALYGGVVGSRVVLCAYPASDTKFLRLSAYDKGSGKQAWAVSETFAGAPPTRLVADEHNLYLAADTLTARRLSDGGLEWLFGNGRDGEGSGGDQRRYGAPTLQDGVVYSVREDQGLLAVDALSGTLNWQEQGLSGRKSKRDVAPAVGKRYAYCVDDKGVRAVDLKSRKAVWTYASEPVVLTADAQGGRLYVRQEKRTLALPLA
ncbi:serine/threonine-protein kinase [Streptomyces sp. RS10V-4]|uniref:serine/threonine-protein kinase n=1 Tax=Streptomyces rhizoryzae TaxID=2932493 RepID=UPI002005AF07|nr:serine/threonine-protein kinase [Streptomyces rhizoryzae]MCK7626551.1 serine/threonine-protein kinase [Streptomyces rhizoryzae]